MKELIKILKDRYESKSPEFFRKMKKIAIRIALSGIAIITINTTFNLNLNPDMINVIGYIVAICAGVAGTAKLTKE